MLPGYSDRTREQLEFWKQRVMTAVGEAEPAEENRRVLEARLDFSSIKGFRQQAPPEFWEKFPVNYDDIGKSLVNPVKLESLARAVGCGDWERLETVCGDLGKGADIGCTGEYREPSVSRNAPSAYEYPKEVTEAIADWIKKGFAKGPFDEKSRPANVKINGIMCRPKPNGSARVILNLSAPAGGSVNDGIDVREFPATMSSTKKWLKVLQKAGRKCLILKIDWADAYKHVHVRKEDVDLQWFSWLGKDFAELCLVFGAISSVGIYDRLAKTVLDVVIRLARFPSEMVCQYLDDIGAACPEKEESLAHFEQAYRKVAAEIGVKLASTDDPDKAFSPCHRGVVLGIEYDTVAWTWRIPGPKLARLLGQIRAVFWSEYVMQEELASLNGRILHYAPLVPSGRFNLNYIIKAAGSSQNRKDRIPVTEDLKRQLWFWWLMLKATDGFVAIPWQFDCMPAWSVEFFTDAAGGTTSSPGHGCGGVGPNSWFYVPWSNKINRGVKSVDGKKLSRKMSALELVGPLVVIAAAFRLCRNSPVRIWVDNIGSVRIWEKGYSASCDLCTTLVKAIATVAAGLGCVVAIEKITRCSVPGAVAADALSKADFTRFRKVTCGLPSDPLWVPRQILVWMLDPKKDDDLGCKILEELGGKTAVLGYNC
jgi:hypothetical protein